MAELDYDIGIIGGGAAGLTVAAGAAQLGAKALLALLNDLAEEDVVALARGAGAKAFMSRRLPDSGEVVSSVLTSGEARSVSRPARARRSCPA